MISFALGFMIFFSQGTAAADGAISGGGGQSVVCRNPDHSIKSARLYDLYEAEIRYGLKITDDPLIDYVAQAIKAGENINGVHDLKSKKETETSIRSFVKRIRFVPREAILVPVDDAKLVVIPALPCAIEQVANYTPDDNLLVSRELWDTFDQTSRAALVLHEMVYYLLRVSPGHATNSTLARKVVGYAFSGVDFGRVDAGVPINAVSCMTNFGPKSTEFWAFQESNGDLSIQFSQLLGQPVFGTTRMRIPNQKVESLVNGTSCWNHFGNLLGVMQSESSFLWIFNKCFFPELSKTASAIIGYPENSTPTPFVCFESAHEGSSSIQWP